MARPKKVVGEPRLRISIYKTIGSGYDSWSIEGLEQEIALAKANMISQSGFDLGFELDKKYEDYDPTVYPAFKYCFYRHETDAEYETRLAELAKIKTDTEEKERKEFLRLAKKFKEV